MNATRRPIPEEILAAVAAGAMPLAVLADWLEENDWPAKLADGLRRAHELPGHPGFMDLFPMPPGVFGEARARYIGKLLEWWAIHGPPL